mmetsp:Transcript_21585/g.30233  ORF Transcript_21585/g.30233 Transcript_21585/m.30233 type:complete len:150 (+) Transcript_21585:1103-1552(+)
MEEQQDRSESLIQDQEEQSDKNEVQTSTGDDPGQPLSNLSGEPDKPTEDLENNIPDHEQVQEELEEESEEIDEEAEVEETIQTRSGRTTNKRNYRYADKYGFSNTQMHSDPLFKFKFQSSSYKKIITPNGFGKLKVTTQDPIPNTLIHT